MTGLMVRERETLEKYMPGLLQYLDTTPLDRLESRDSDAIDKFREFGGTGLVVPGELGGLGAPAIDAVRAQRAIGSRSPSLGAGTTMHHLSLASLTEFARGATDDDRALIKGLVDQKAIVASGFSDGGHRRECVHSDDDRREEGRQLHRQRKQEAVQSGTFDGLADL
ncbi:hypothetical protein QNA19_22235 [Rhodococcus fascians]|uniref:hypothetical protein n=1 Tax=Rhodococcoides fascians TaxID=1828 RepID=UPI0024B8E1C5|nr:hypothetical protein [Rhodococcus fascians]MDJ0428660.1 hypothetical protein [Rhodococcus fascians]